MGICYYDGKGISQDYSEAYKWYRKSAEQGDAGGQCSLGLCYKEGHGVAIDYEEACKWLDKAIEQGNERAKSLKDDLKESGKIVGSEECPKCGALIPVGKKFCSKCGNPLRVNETKIPGKMVVSELEQSMTCPGCGRLIKSGKKFCSACGRKLEL